MNPLYKVVFRHLAIEISELTLTKYYVTTGPYKIVLMARSPAKAAEIAIKRFVDRSKKFRPGTFTNVSEVGFCMEDDESSPDHKNDKLYESAQLAEDLKQSILAKMKGKKR